MIEASGGPAGRASRARVAAPPGTAVGHRVLHDGVTVGRDTSLHGAESASGAFARLPRIAPTARAAPVASSRASTRAQRRARLGSRSRTSHGNAREDAEHAVAKNGAARLVELADRAPSALPPWSPICTRCETRRRSPAAIDAACAASRMSAAARPRRACIGPSALRRRDRRRGGEPPARARRRRRLGRPLPQPLRQPLPRRRHRPAARRARAARRGRRRHHRVAPGTPRQVRLRRRARRGARRRARRRRHRRAAGRRDGGERGDGLRRRRRPRCRRRGPPAGPRPVLPARPAPEACPWPARPRDSLALHAQESACPRRACSTRRAGPRCATAAGGAVDGRARRRRRAARDAQRAERRGDPPSRTKIVEKPAAPPVVALVPLQNTGGCARVDVSGGLRQRLRTWKWTRTFSRRPDAASGGRRWRAARGGGRRRARPAGRPALRRAVARGNGVAEVRLTPNRALARSRTSRTLLRAARREPLTPAAGVRHPDGGGRPPLWPQVAAARRRARRRRRVPLRRRSCPAWSTSRPAAGAISCVSPRSKLPPSSAAARGLAQPAGRGGLAEFRYTNNLTLSPCADGAGASEAQLVKGRCMSKIGGITTTAATSSTWATATARCPRLPRSSGRRHRQTQASRSVPRLRSEGRRRSRRLEIEGENDERSWPDDFDGEPPTFPPPSSPWRPVLRGTAAPSMATSQRSGRRRLPLRRCNATTAKLLPLASRARRRAGRRASPTAARSRCASRTTRAAVLGERAPLVARRPGPRPGRPAGGRRRRAGKARALDAGRRCCPRRRANEPAERVRRDGRCDRER